MFKIIIPADAIDFHCSLVKDSIVENIKIVKGYSGLDPKFHELLEWLTVKEYENLEILVKAEPQKLLDIYNEWKNNFQFNISGENIFGDEGVQLDTYKQHFKQIFNYKEFCDTKNAYSLTEKLKIRVCPYCNRQFVFTVVDAKTAGRKHIIRPELDHYFPQSKYPMFALSFYNLIPCCHICNSNIKGQRDLDLKLHFHPYIEEEKKLKFKYTKAATGKAVIKYDYCGSTKAENTFKFFYLEEIYQGHNDEADRLMNLYNEYDKDVIEDTHKKLTDAGLYVSKKRLLDIIYNHYVVKNPDNEILGNLRADMYEQVKKIYFS